LISTLSTAPIIAVTEPILLPQTPNGPNSGYLIYFIMNYFSLIYLRTFKKSSFSYHPNDTYCPSDIPLPPKSKFTNEIPSYANIFA
jgi:hypothetical protein